MESRKYRVGTRSYDINNIGNGILGGVLVCLSIMFHWGIHVR